MDRAELLVYAGARSFRFRLKTGNYPPLPYGRGSVSGLCSVSEVFVPLIRGMRYRRTTGFRRASAVGQP
jgi:hypothetical protein